MGIEANDADHEKRMEELYPEEPNQMTDDINIVDIEDFLSREIPPRKLLLPPWLPEQGTVLIHAARGVGKTHFALSVGYALASGGDFLKWTVPEPVSVLILDGEMPASALQDRLADIVKANDKTPKKPLRLMTPDLQPRDRPSFNLANIDDQLALDKLATDIDVIIVDNISTLCRLGKENEAESWGPLQSWALSQRTQGRSVIFIHHSGKDGKQRGTSKREDIIDSIICLRHPSDYSPEEGAKFELNFEKNRGFWSEDAAPLQAQLVTDEDGIQHWDYSKLEDAVHESIIKLYNEGASQKDIAIEVDRNKSNISRHVKQARAEGRIKKKGGTNE